jgi:hypothetical protein
VPERRLTGVDLLATNRSVESIRRVLTGVASVEYVPLYRVVPCRRGHGDNPCQPSTLACGWASILRVRMVMLTPLARSMLQAFAEMLMSGADRASS